MKTATAAQHSKQQKRALAGVLSYGCMSAEYHLLLGMHNNIGMLSVSANIDFKMNDQNQLMCFFVFCTMNEYYIH